MFATNCRIVTAGEYDVSGGADNTWTLTMKPTILAAAENPRPLDRSIDNHHRSREQASEWSEPVNCSLRPGRFIRFSSSFRVVGRSGSGVRDIIQVDFDAYRNMRSREKAQAATPASKRRWLPWVARFLQTRILMHGDSQDNVSGGGDRVFLLKRVSIVGGNDFRDAQRNRDQRHRQAGRETSCLTNDGGPAIL